MLVKRIYHSLLDAGFSEDQLMLSEPMSRHTTFAIGGPADIFVMPHSEEQICAVYQATDSDPITVVGNGSNLLVKDGGIRGVVMQLGAQYQSIQVCGQQIRAQAGASMRALGLAAQQARLTGMECLCGIPGNIGGALAMNAGAYGGTISDHLLWVKVFQPKQNQCAVYPVQELDYGYRQSRILQEGWVVLEGCWQFEFGDAESIRSRMLDFTNQRRTKQPLSWPSAGSVFKRPEGYFAGALIEKAGLKGYRIGDAQVSSLHAGFIVNVGHASAKQVLDLIAYIQQTVHERNGVWLEPEIRIIGED